MKKILSLILAAILAFSCVAAAPDRTALASNAPADAAELEMIPSSMLLPMFSVSSGEKLRVRVNGAIAQGSLFTWTSSDTAVVTVDEAGGLHAAAPGTAVITAANEEGGSAQCSVTVVDDAEFPRLADVPAAELSLPFYSEEVGIGPLCGAQPMFLKRFINPPGCGDTPQPDPDELLVSEGWTYTYAVVFRFTARYGHSYRFVTSASDAEGASASNAYVCIYDQFFNLWSYSRGSAVSPYGQLTLDSYEDSDFYLVITPYSHTDDAGSGNICLYAYDVTQPFAQGDVDRDHYVTAIDALLALRFAMDLIQLEGDAFLLADMTGDGEVESDDALLILRIALGIGA